MRIFQCKQALLTQFVEINHTMLHKTNLCYVANSTESEKLVPALSRITVQQQVPVDSFNFS